MQIHNDVSAVAKHTTTFCMRERRYGKHAFTASQQRVLYAAARHMQRDPTQHSCKMTAAMQWHVLVAHPSHAAQTILAHLISQPHQQAASCTNLSQNLHNSAMRYRQSNTVRNSTVSKKCPAAFCSLCCRHKQHAKT